MRRLRGIATQGTAPFTPASISSLYFWFNPDSESYANDASVDVMHDRSGNGRDASQSTASAKPTFKTNYINGKSALSFDGGDYLNFASGVLQLERTTPQTFFGVANLSSVASTRAIIGDYDINNPVANGYRGFSHQLGATSGSAYCTLITNNVGFHRIVTYETNTRNTGTWYYGISKYEGDSDADTVTFRRNGVAQAKTITTDALDGTVLNNALAQFGAAGSNVNYFNGYIAECGIYTKSLSSGEITQLEAYLASKYGI